MVHKLLTPPRPPLPAGFSSRPIFKYITDPHFVPATCRSLAATSINAEFPSGKFPTTRVRCRTYRITRSKGLFVLILSQCLRGKYVYDSVSAALSSATFAVFFSRVRESKGGCRRITAIL
jgi:hypothetical protein